MQAFEGAESSQPAWPLASVCDGLADGDAPTLVQLLVEPKTGLELPSRALLNTYLSADGMHIGHPQTANRELLDATVSLPPAAHPLHTAVFGSSGAGKTERVSPKTSPRSSVRHTSGTPSIRTVVR